MKKTSVVVLYIDTSFKVLIGKSSCHVETCRLYTQRTNANGGLKTHVTGGPYVEAGCAKHRLLCLLFFSFDTTAFSSLSPSRPSVLVFIINMTTNMNFGPEWYGIETVKAQKRLCIHTL